MTAARKVLQDFQSFETLDISSQEFSYFADKMYSLSGVYLPLNDKNMALLKNRLAKLLRKYSLPSYKALAAKLNEPNAINRDEFISCLTTNKTDFFREGSHFTFLAKQLKTHFEKNSELRIWCAAASTGQEPYTLAMVCAENLKPNELSRTKILATDIDLQALQKGADGFYSAQELAGIPPGIVPKYMDELAGQYRFNEQLIQMISFCPFNLVNDAYQFQNKFDFVFCRNVLIYFDEATCNKVISGLISTLRPGGNLFLGHSEAGVMKLNTVDNLTGAIYRRKP